MVQQPSSLLTHPLPALAVMWVCLPPARLQQGCAAAAAQWYGATHQCHHLRVKGQKGGGVEQSLRGSAVNIGLGPKLVRMCRSNDCFTAPAAFDAPAAAYMAELAAT